MKQKLFIYLPLILLVLVICCKRVHHNVQLQEKGKSQTCLLCLLQQIDSLLNLGEYNAVVFEDFIVKTEEFTSNYPEDPNSVEYLYKAALMAMTLAKISDNSEEKELYGKKAISFFDDIQMIYPEFCSIKNCILNKCILYDEILNDHKSAEFCYREYIARYSSDTLTGNFESYLQYLGKSPEEILTENH